MANNPVNPLPANASPAFVKFHESLAMNYERWHDGAEIDLDSAGEMTIAEQQQALVILQSRPQTPREIEAIAGLIRRGVDGSDDSIARLERVAIDAYAPSVNRLAALDALNDLGRVPDFEQRLAREIRKLTQSGPGLTRALLMAEGRPSETIKQALLWASWNQTDCAPFCAGLLCYLTGVTGEPFDFAERELFLQFNMHTSYFERKAAFDELCRRVNMVLQAEQD